MIIFIVDDILKIIYKKRVIKCKLKDVIVKGRIVNKSSFMEEFMKIQKKEKIKLKFLGENIEVIKDSFYLVSDLAFIENIFLELGFNKVIFKDIKDYYEDKYSIIELNNSYMVVKDLFLDLDYFKDIVTILDYLKDYIKKDLIFWGLNKNIPKIKLKNKNVYYYENYESYLEDKILKDK